MFRVLAALVALTALLLASGSSLACDACQEIVSDPQDDSSTWMGAVAEPLIDNGATAVDGNTTRQVDDAAKHALTGATKTVDDADHQIEEARNETLWTVSEVAIKAYDEVMEWYPTSIPRFEVKGVSVGGQSTPPISAHPSNLLETRPEPTKDEVPRVDDAVRQTRDDLLPSRSGAEAAGEDAVPEASVPEQNTSDGRLERMTPGAFQATPYADRSTPDVTAPQDEGPPTETDFQPKSGTVSRAVPPWNAGIAIAGGLAGVAFLTWLVSRGGLFARLAAYLPVARLFSRQAGEEVLQHPGRRRIYDAIADQPGISRPQLSQVTGVAASTLRYHLTVLRREGVVHAARGGKILHYHAQPIQADALAGARHCLFRRRRALLARIILSYPGTSQQAIAQRTGVPPSRVCSYVRDLARNGLVEVEKAGRFTNYYASPRLKTLQEEGQVPEP